MRRDRIRWPSLTVARSWAIAHDAVVIAAALLALVIASIVHSSMSRPELASFSAAGLSLRYPQTWLPGSIADSEKLPIHSTSHPLDTPLVRLEVIIDHAPPKSSAIDFVLSTRRRAAFAAVYYREADTTTAGDWRRCTFEYAFIPTQGSAPVIEHAIELAQVKGDRLYVVRVHAPSPDELSAVADLIVPTLELKE